MFIVVVVQICSEVEMRQASPHTEYIHPSFQHLKRHSRVEACCDPSSIGRAVHTLESQSVQQSIAIHFYNHKPILTPTTDISLRYWTYSNHPYSSKSL
ncbi:hypothetical protein WAI453_003524 [Rhynchosporium graminicola]